MSGTIGFRPLAAEDLPRMYRWLHAPQVKAWWDDYRDSYAAFAEKYAPDALAAEDVHGYIILYDGMPVGYIQMWRHGSDPESAACYGADLDADARGVDLFIGEAEYVHRGLGARIVRRFVDEIVFATGAPYAFIDPSPDNRIAIRAYEKAGFRHIYTKQCGDETIYLMKRERPSPPTPLP